MNPDSPIDRAISEVIADFQLTPGKYFTEEDVRWQLIKRLDSFLLEAAGEAPLLDGITTAIHAEYPTPYRCSMTNRSFALAPAGSKAQRGHFDIVLLNRRAAAKCNFEVVRSQHYRTFLAMLPKLPLPFLDCVVEVKLYRDLALPNGTNSPGQQAQYAVQAVRKVAATLEALPEYYPKPFARRGIVLLFDNSHLAYSGSITQARSYFRKAFEAAFDWSSLPETLTCIWVTADEKRSYTGTRTPSLGLSR